MGPAPNIKGGGKRNRNFCRLKQDLLEDRGRRGRTLTMIEYVEVGLFEKVLGCQKLQKQLRIENRRWKGKKRGSFREDRATPGGGEQENFMFLGLPPLRESLVNGSRDRITFHWKWGITLRKGQNPKRHSRFSKRFSRKGATGK